MGVLLPEQTLKECNIGNQSNVEVIFRLRAGCDEEPTRRSIKRAMLNDRTVTLLVTVDTLYDLEDRPAPQPAPVSPRHPGNTSEAATAAGHIPGPATRASALGFIDEQGGMDEEDSPPHGTAEAAIETPATTASVVDAQHSAGNDCFLLDISGAMEAEEEMDRLRADAQDAISEATCPPPSDWDLPSELEES